MSTFQSLQEGEFARRSKAAGYGRRLFVPLSQVLGLLAVTIAAALSWFVWQHLPFAPPSLLELHLRLGFAGALLAVVLTVLRGEHTIAFHTAGENTPAKTLRTWNMAFVLLMLMAFLTRRADELSRGTVVLFYVTGFGALWWSRAVSTRALRIASKLRVVAAQRLLVVGTEAGISDFLRRYQPWNWGYEVVGTISVDPATALGRTPSPEFQRAVDVTRRLDVDDVFVAVPWSDLETIDLCIEAFLNAPITIHLAPERVLDRFDHISIARVGPMASLELTRPMSAFAVAVKRVFDFVFAGMGLVLLSPLLLLVALAIRLDSRGPALFFQTRYGFNQARFRIVKFRTMSTFADGAVVPQATKDDPRITRVGRLLRRTNLDELPQLLNVLGGQMSLVGPRPHAVPHNRAFERRIDLYARRHNVRPGITGWAQVNGLRGETDTDAKMRRRVEHDLYYIDNWSLLFDLRILFRTVFSRRAWRNAR